METPVTAAGRDPYRSVVAFLLAAALLGVGAAIAGNAYLTNKVLLDVGVAFGIAAGMVGGVVVQQAARVRRRRAEPDGAPPGAAAGLVSEREPAPVDPTPTDPAPPGAPPADVAQATGEPTEGEPTGTAPVESTKAGTVPSTPFNLIPVTALQVSNEVERWVKKIGPSGVIAVVTSVVALFAVLRILTRISYVLLPSPLALAIGAGSCLVLAAFAATTARYLASIDAGALAEAPGLARGARVMAWLLVAAAASLGAEWSDQFTTVRIIHLIVAALLVGTVYSLFQAGARAHEHPDVFPVDLGPVSMLGSRPN